MIFLALGIISWIIFEYVMHRFVLHHNPMDITHKYHHLNPKDRSKIIISPFTSIPISILYCIIAYLLFGMQSMMLCYSTFLSGYILYEIIHYKVHYSKPKSNILRYLRKHHFQHHHKYKDKNFGVTSPIMDYLFNTKI